MVVADKILIDGYSYYHRIIAGLIQPTTKTVVDLYISNIQSLKQQTFGEVYLLLDPPVSGRNLGLSERKASDPRYKANRVNFNKSEAGRFKIKVMDLLTNTLMLKPIPRVHVYQQINYEADDYVEKLTESGKCILITTDEDWARYLEKDRVEMLTSGLSLSDDNLFTEKDYENKYGFKPTIATVSIYKALMSDESDNIIGVFKDKRFIILKQVVDELMSVLKVLGDENIPLYEACKSFYEGVGFFEKTQELIKLSCNQKSLDKLLEGFDSNLSLIKSAIPRQSDIDVTKFESVLDCLKPKTKKLRLNSARLKNNAK